ncbi:MAG TPA: hypothetical protein VFK02_30320 [Kofleriaceae bacterium]|nr:hypothetical protein [Kofleriaceae bacterium]
MAPPVHPRILRGADPSTPTGEKIRVLVYAPSPVRASWVEAELASSAVMVQIGFSVEHVVSALVEDPPPRPQILVADFDEMNAGELMHLHVLREQGWFGRIIALGEVPDALRSSLAIERVLGAPFARDALREVITDTEFVAPTTRLPIL